MDIRWICRVVAVLMLGCGGGAVGTGVGTTSGTGPETSGTGMTSGTPTTGGDGTTGGVTSSTGDEAGTTCGATSCEEPIDPVPIKCDVFAQDCPEGEKCAPWADGGGSSWNATKCMPVTGDGQPGDPCTAPEGGVSGLDDCAEGALCWDIDEQSQGACIAMCGGTTDAPVCPEETSCVSVNNDVLNLCFPDCDPLAQDCPFDKVCLLVENAFICVIEAQSNAGVFDDCQFANDCMKGLLCSEASWAVECHPESEACCLPMCDLGDPEGVCPGVGQSCVSIYAPGMAPPKYANVGVCRIPE